ncbi:MAG: translation elongation factor Ts [Candidatus Glassbacteria bacterium]
MSTEQISAADVKKLRERTSAGMMDCKKALVEARGDMELAQDILRKKGLSRVARRSNRVAEEGIVESYIHPGNKIGVLIEINCETDFVARTDDFKKLAKDLAMQVAATNPMAVDRESIDERTIGKEREIYKAQALESGKPEKIVEKIVDGRMNKFFQEVCLIEQAFVKDTDKTVTDVVNEVSAKTGEKIVIRRFVRYQLGE